MLKLLRKQRLTKIQGYFNVRTKNLNAIQFYNLGRVFETLRYMYIQGCTKHIGNHWNWKPHQFDGYHNLYKLKIDVKLHFRKDRYFKLYYS